MNLSLEGKHALVCGSSRGIGAAVAEELALLGATCILLARDEEKLKQTTASLNTACRQQHRYFVVDFSNEQAIRRLAGHLAAEMPIHILVNNSGGPAAGPILEASEAAFLQAFQQHLITSHILVKALVPAMKIQGFGRIVNIISTSVKIPLRNLGVSNTIRGAMASWAKTLANELGQFNITVNNVLPGFTTTERLESLIEHSALKTNSAREDVEAKMKEEVPMKRFGKPAEIAAVVAFLCSPAASYVNGTSIAVDGGRTGSI